MQSVSTVFTPHFSDTYSTYRYKPDVKLRFVTEELGFESEGEAVTFICDHGGQDFLKDREGGAYLITGTSVGLFDAARKAAFGKVDIKGQI